MITNFSLLVVACAGLQLQSNEENQHPLLHSEDETRDSYPEIPVIPEIVKQESSIKLERDSTFTSEISCGRSLCHRVSRVLCYFDPSLTVCSCIFASIVIWIIVMMAVDCPIWSYSCKSWQITSCHCPIKYVQTTFDYPDHNITKSIHNDGNNGSSFVQSDGEKQEPLLDQQENAVRSVKYWILMFIGVSMCLAATALGGYLMWILAGHLIGNGL